MAEWSRGRRSCCGPSCHLQAWWSRRYGTFRKARAICSCVRKYQLQLGDSRRGRRLKVRSPQAWYRMAWKRRDRPDSLRCCLYCRVLRCRTAADRGHRGIRLRSKGHHRHCWKIRLHRYHHSCRCFRLHHYLPKNLTWMGRQRVVLRASSDRPRRSRSLPHCLMTRCRSVPASVSPPLPWLARNSRWSLGTCSRR